MSAGAGLVDDRRARALCCPTGCALDNGRAADRCDLPLGLAVFHADAKVDYGAMFQGPAHDAMIDYMASLLVTMARGG